MKVDPATLDVTRGFTLQHHCIVPRPVFLVSTVSETGVFNVAPFSYFTGVSYYPPTLCFSVQRRDGVKKDTLRNIEFSRDFVVSIADEPLAEPMHQSAFSYPPDVSEFIEVGLTPVKSDRVKAPCVAESPINMECTLVNIVEVGEMPYTTSLVIGEVVLYHIKDEFYIDGTVDLSKLKIIGVLGAGMQAVTYCRMGDVFRMLREEPPVRDAGV